MAILVAGAAGFIGSHLIKRFLDEGSHVIAIDNLSTGRRSNIPESPALAFHGLDVARSLGGWDSWMGWDSLYQIDQVYNLACPASPPAYQADPIQTWKTSVYGTHNLLEIARIAGARFLQASTSEVYGDPLEHPQSEGYWGNVNPIGLRACYDEGKRAAESIIYDYNRVHGLDVRVARIFNTYGPNMDPKDGRVVSNFVCQALRGQKMTVYGKGDQTRSFCYVSDMVDGLIKLMASNETSPVNLGNPGEFTMVELGEMVGDKVNLRAGPKFEHLPLPADDPKVRRPDITRARTILGWEPKVSLSEGLDHTIEYFRKVA